MECDNILFSAPASALKLGCRCCCCCCRWRGTPDC